MKKAIIKRHALNLLELVVGGVACYAILMLIDWIAAMNNVRGL